MKFYSTNDRKRVVDLQTAVTQGLAPDNGLYMPETIPTLSQDFIVDIENRTFKEIALEVSKTLLGGAIPTKELEEIVSHTIQFDAPLVEIEKDIYALELFHGPTLAFKDFGARFMSRMLGYFAKKQDREIVILVATSGDTGSAVANGFLGVENTRVIVLYPSGKVSDIQEKQFTTLGQNVTAVEIAGSFDDCQHLVKQAFLDKELQQKYFLTSANSINIARLIPQSFYYFNAYAQLSGNGKPIVFSVPSGNFGNLTGGLLAQRMGLPIHHFVAATNSNDVVPEFLRTKVFDPRKSLATISNAMDVGNPSNFTRMLDLFKNDFESIAKAISGFAFTDEETKKAMRNVYSASEYVLDPHGAIGYLGLKSYLKGVKNAQGVFLETAHPAKFREVVEEVLGTNVEVPATLQAFLNRKKESVQLTADFAAFKTYLGETL